MFRKAMKPQSEDRRTFLKSAGLLPAVLYLDGCATNGRETKTTAESAATAGSMTTYAAGRAWLADAAPVARN